MNGKLKLRLSAAALIVFLAAVGGLYTYLYLIPDITGALMPTAVIGYGELSVADSSKCIIVRSETPVFAEQDGSVSRYAAENEKTRKGSKVLDVYPAEGSGQAYKAASTGFVSYYYDGWEGYFTPDTIGTIKLDDLPEEPIEVVSTVKDSASKGDVLYKLINSDTWYIVLIVSEDRMEYYSINAQLEVEFEDGFKVRGNVMEMLNRGDYYYVVVKTGRFYENFSRIRQADVKVITKEYRGLAVPNSALAFDETGAEGVYVLEIDGGYSFTPVNVLVRGAYETIVSEDDIKITQEDGTVKTVGTVSIYDEVLRNPESKSK